MSPTTRARAVVAALALLLLTAGAYALPARSSADANDLSQCMMDQSRGNWAAADASCTLAVHKALIAMAGATVNEHTRPYLRMDYSHAAYYNAQVALHYNDHATERYWLREAAKYALLVLHDPMKGTGFDALRKQAGYMYRNDSSILAAIDRPAVAAAPTPTAAPTPPPVSVTVAWVTPERARYFPTSV